MEKYLIFVVIANLPFYGTLADIGKCDEYADIPEPPCCGSPISLEGRIKKNVSTPIFDEEVPYFVTVAGGVGTLISARWVLTCAHCLANGAIPVKIVVSEKGKGRKIEADFWMHHPLHRVQGVNKDVVYDIALVRTIEPFNITKTTQPLCLPTSRKFKALDYTDKNATIIGWSWGEIEGQKVNKAKKVVPILPSKRCPHGLTFGQLCTRRYNTGGDSGSALSMLTNYNSLGLKARYVVGVCNIAAWYDNYFTRVDGVIEWIKAVIEANKD